MRKMILLTIVVLVLSVSTSRASDFRNATWGMSRDECFDSEDAKNCIFVDEDNKQYFKTRIFEAISHVMYIFKDNKLERGAVIVFGNDKSHAMLIFNDIKNVLSKRHPNFERVSSDMYEFKNDRTVTQLFFGENRHGPFVITDYISIGAKRREDQESFEKRKEDAENF